MFLLIIKKINDKRQCTTPGHMSWMEHTHTSQREPYIYMCRMSYDDPFSWQKAWSFMEVAWKLSELEHVYTSKYRWFLTNDVQQVLPLFWQATAVVVIVVQLLPVDCDWSCNDLFEITLKIHIICCFHTLLWILLGLGHSEMCCWASLGCHEEIKESQKVLL